MLPNGEMLEEGRNIIGSRCRWCDTGTAYVSDRSGSGDEIHVVVIDEDMEISQEECFRYCTRSFSGVSKAADAKTPQGASNYYPDVIYNQSQYVYWMDHNTSGSNWGSNAAGTTFTAVNTPLESLSAGADGSTRTVAELKTAYDKFVDSNS